jgi:hypothetical protein
VRVYSVKSSASARKLAVEVFPEFSDSVLPVAEDWLGRQFCVGLKRGDGPKRRILFLEPGSGEVFEIDGGLPELFNVE